VRVPHWEQEFTDLSRGKPQLKSLLDSLTVYVLVTPDQILLDAVYVVDWAKFMFLFT
jgi:hypothetical protein